MIPWLVLRLLGIKKAIASAFAWVTQSMTRILAVLLVLALLWGLIERNSRVKAEKVLASTVAAWKSAEREATAAQIAANSAQQARWAQQAKETDDDYRKARIDADGRSERFIRAGGVRANCPRGPGIGDTVQGPGAAPSADGPGESSIVVTVVPDDVRICTENTLRLQAGREWALGLATAGD